MHVDLKAQERRELYRYRVMGIGNTAGIRRDYIRKWQERWDSSDTGRKTHLLLPNVIERLNMRIDVTYYLVQFLRRDGNFGAYLKRFGMRDSEVCATCEMVDTPEHELYDCID